MVGRSLPQPDHPRANQTAVCPGPALTGAGLGRAARGRGHAAQASRARGRVGDAGRGALRGGERAAAGLGGGAGDAGGRRRVPRTSERPTLLCACAPALLPGHAGSLGAAALRLRGGRFRGCTLRGPGACLPEPPGRWPPARPTNQGRFSQTFSPTSVILGLIPEGARPQHGQPWPRAGPARGRGRGHVPAGDPGPVGSPENLGGAGSATPAGERRRHWDSPSGGRGSRMAQGLETWKHGAHTWRYWAGTSQSAHAGVETRGGGESWWTCAALQDRRSAVPWKHLRPRQAPL